jgi:hypothetical protein
MKSRLGTWWPAGDCGRIIRMQKVIPSFVREIVKDGAVPCDGLFGKSLDVECIFSRRGQVLLRRAVQLCSTRSGDCIFVTFSFLRIGHGILNHLIMQNFSTPELPYSPSRLEL